ncbi:D-glycero-D-manno-heptose 1,7-bisphosphate phosphatase [Bradyrhizobium japonicum USDA 38]|uniref:HAD-IIIA family hydrolase n=1 Tax=Bradyrhizobium japonicum TaxID=375 RepID=UPI0003F6B262|nr:HAD-IIIA family hydrolase [Bradyrhizobium japonicum]MCS3894573.1 D-glycero-D-manno-heptose 1,7-bisphosphate phosphatase [Bradyrhizobium japonicum USDA 38]MCS3947087.1 D-glycero-D-manno-heptose 1,7-bisphosphate phosphatase [Bradyrhizobium japonicum]MCW2220082.1 D-glycero-D-manno-heptose 1,7-bisphosphate phosphatase [Bradyrhizobium japonicum]MCW2344696.1 D-glycero-D-manno-heptose 1,7-bisphosphate phosphatase [Bradyrhizobium japonicum]
MVKQAVVLLDDADARSGEALPPIPAPLQDVAGQPFLDYLLDELSRYPTIEQILLLAGRGEQRVADRYHGRSWRGATLSVVSSDSSGAGALKCVAERLQERFFLLNGCLLFDFNLLDLASRAQRSPAIAQVALTSGGIDRGIYCVDRRILNYVREAPCSLENQVVPRLIAEGQFEAASYGGFFVDVSGPSGLDRARTELPDRLRRPAVFFDRDGVLNVDKNYLYRIDDFEWMPGAREAIRLCNDLRYYAFVVTNQSGVARGHYGVDDIHRLHDWMSGELAAIGAHIDDFQYCPYHEEGTVEAYRRTSDRRKPAPGMILDCMKAWPVRTEGSLLVGDNARDIGAAVAAGIPGHLFQGGDLASFLRPLLAARS